MFATMTEKTGAFDWPDDLTDAEFALRADFERLSSLGSLMHAFVLHRGILCKAAALPATVPMGEMRQCYRNAANLALSNPSKYTYVEGYGHNFITTQHAWCITRDGTVIDPTWKSPEACAYLGIPINYSFLVESLQRKRVFGIFDDVVKREMFTTAIDAMVHADWQTVIQKRPLPERLAALMN